MQRRCVEVSRCVVLGCLVAAGCHPPRRPRAPAAVVADDVAIVGATDAVSDAMRDAATDVATRDDVVDATVYGPATGAEPVHRPCEIVVTAAHPDDSWVVLLRRVQPEGVALTLSSDVRSPLRFAYDARGRIVRSPDARYVYAADGSATRITASGRARARFDAAHRLLSLGATRYRYDAAGRLVRLDDPPYVVTLQHEANGTFAVGHNHPDRDEFCEPSLAAVTCDAQGRPIVDRYEDCGISYTPVTLRYRYDGGGRLDRVTLDLQNDGSDDVALELGYACADGPSPGDASVR